MFFFEHATCALPAKHVIVMQLCMSVLRNWYVYCIYIDIDRYCINKTCIILYNTHMFQATCSVPLPGAAPHLHRKKMLLVFCQHGDGLMGRSMGVDPTPENNKVGLLVGKTQLFV